MENLRSTYSQEKEDDAELCDITALHIGMMLDATCMR